MELKKIDKNLQQSLIDADLTEANEMQFETFSTIKSGLDCVIIAPTKMGKTTTIVINVIQKLLAEGEESPRALIFVENRDKVVDMVNLFKKLTTYSPLRVYGVHEKGDIDYDKNHISTGIDVLIGTPTKINDLFSSAGFNVNRLKMFVVDDCDTLLRLRHELKIVRMANGISKVQKLIFSETLTERVENFAFKLNEEPEFFEFE